MTKKQLSKCPYCGEDLKHNLAYGQTGTMFFKIYPDGEFVGYEYDEFEAEDSGFYYCRNCLKELDLDYTKDEKRILNLVK